MNTIKKLSDTLDIAFSTFERHQHRAEKQEFTLNGFEAVITHELGFIEVQLDSDIFEDDRLLIDNDKEDVRYRCEPRTIYIQCKGVSFEDAKKINEVFLMVIEKLKKEMSDLSESEKVFLSAFES